MMGLHVVHACADTRTWNRRKGDIERLSCCGEREVHGEVVVVCSATQRERRNSVFLRRDETPVRTSGASATAIWFNFTVQVTNQVHAPAYCSCTRRDARCCPCNDFQADARGVRGGTH